MKIDCPFANECVNYKSKYCKKCKWNKALGIGDFLEIKSSRLMLLEKENGISTRKGLSTMQDVD